MKAFDCFARPARPLVSVSLLISLLVSSHVAAQEAVSQDDLAKEFSADPAAVVWERVEITQTRDAAGNPINMSRALRSSVASGLATIDTAYLPVVNDQASLNLFLTGNRVSSASSLQRMDHYMQAVPGLPDSRYTEPEFNDIRNAFGAGCASSANRYQNTALQLSQMLATSGNAAAFLSSARPESYDTDCLTPLSKVPDNVKRVVGVLKMEGNSAFCTATIVGRREILTSRHCFVTAEQGEATAARSSLYTNEISFIPLVAQNGRATFTVAAPSPTLLPLTKFSPADDQVRLSVKSWDLQFSAQTDVVLQKSSKMPLAAWVVGSNPTMINLTGPHTVLDTARGSAPLACSILEVTESGCIYHSCQTGPATSGAGLLVVKGDKTVSVVGIHKGPMATSVGCEAKPQLNLKLNIAAVLAN